MSQRKKRKERQKKERKSSDKHRQDPVKTQDGNTGTVGSRGWGKNFRRNKSETLSLGYIVCGMAGHAFLCQWQRSSLHGVECEEGDTKAVL